MSIFLTAIIVITALIIIFVVIMQPSKDGGLGGLASGGVTDSVFGAGRNEFLAKATWVLLIIFLVTSVALAKHITTEKDALEREQTQKSEAEMEADVEAPQADVETPQAKEDTQK